LTISQVFTIKSDHGLRKADYDKIDEWAKNTLPEANRLKENFYVAKSMMKSLGLGYQNIDTCPNFYFLYYSENVNFNECRTCGHSQYKPKTRSNLIECILSFQWNHEMCILGYVQWIQSI